MYIKHLQSLQCARTWIKTCVLLGLMLVWGSAYTQRPFFFPGEQFGQASLVMPQNQQVLQSNFGDNYESLHEFTEQSRYRLQGRAVGRLDILVEDRTGKRFVSTCTASLIATNYILTNHHCTHGSELLSSFNIVDMVLRMGYLSSDDSGEVFGVLPNPIDLNEALDYVILQIDGSPGDVYGTVDLTVRDPLPNEELFLIHHPAGGPQTLTRKSCRLVDLNTGDASILRHRCDTSGGSSGALLFSDNDNSAIGLHFAGSANPRANLPNSAKRLATVLVRSATLQSVAQGVNIDSDVTGSEVTSLIQAAQQGGTVQLRAGTYELSQVLRVSQNLRVSGVGAARTILVARGGNTLIELVNEATLELVGVTLRYEGHPSSSTVWASAGHIIMHESRISGSSGHGLYLSGSARADVVDSEFFDNGGSGLYGAGSSHLRLENSIIRGNTTGVQIKDSATAELLGNVSDINRRYGLSAQGTSNITASDNFFRDNEASGIYLAGQTRGIYTGNTIDNNVYSGVNVEGAAAPDLARNTLRGNGHAGISYLNGAAGTATRNISESNGFHGIVVRNEASPMLEDNVLRNNSGAGLAYYELSSGIATGNTIEGNTQGIIVSDASTPTLSNNILRDNDQANRIFRPVMLASQERTQRSSAP
ncbi:MAG: right-handed parallel beta-helix repeat-containing protein [Deinococcota bacterium]